ncbi:MAG: glutaredoxin family protein [Clostridiales bacterium]|nr:glutaredoxin family protein [Clostridiales bacterium]
MDKVTIYTSAGCGYCQQAKIYFKNNNIAFVEKKADVDSIARNELAGYGATGVPLIIVNGEVIKGFNKARLDVLLKKPIIQCPNCRASLRIPKNKNIIIVTCSKCKNKFKVDTNKL